LADAYKRFPDAKYYIDIEADTYLFLPNLLRWLSALDHTSMDLFGSPVKIEDAGWWFAHGGSGAVLSKGLMDATFGAHADHVEHVMDDFQAFACCGDEILARALYSTPDVYIKAPSPISHQLFSGETHLSMRYRQKNWCQPIMALHHVHDMEIAQLAQFDKQLFSRLLPNDFIRHIDLFNAFAPPFLLEAYAADEAQIASSDWENRCEDDKIPAVEGQPYNADFCRDACLTRWQCWQWQFSESDGCILGDQLLRVGAKREGFISGWMLRRFKKMRSEEPCENRRMLT
jgi:hypothetical protein